VPAVGGTGDIVGRAIGKRQAAGAQAEQACEAENSAAKPEPHPYERPGAKWTYAIPPDPRDDANVLQRQAAVLR
jgi:hypothetical protein